MSTDFRTLRLTLWLIGTAGFAISALTFAGESPMMEDPTGASSATASEQVAANDDTQAAAPEDAQEDPYAEVRSQLTLCFSCHGENGQPLLPEYPILAGQHLHYIYSQLKDYKAGRRSNALMAPMAMTLEKPQMLLIAQYFSEQPWPEAEYASTPAADATGKRIGTAGQCVQCHLGGYLGASGVPRLADQSPAYLAQTMLDLKYKRRTNAAAKSSLFASFSDEHITAAAQYLSALKSGQINR